MKNSIHYAPEAQNDLDEIWEYITFAPLSSVTDIESDYRFLTRGNYMVFYRVNGQAGGMPKHDLWRELVGSGKLTEHLLDVDNTAQEWMDRMLPQMMEAAGVTEEWKTRDQLTWVGPGEILAFFNFNNSQTIPKRC